MPTPPATMIASPEHPWVPRGVEETSPVHHTKGRRGPSRTSCAECRRLKLKCDGKIPCQQCSKRGYADLCPNGSLATGQGHRIFWDTAIDSRSRILIYKSRIRDLENALRSAYSMISHEPHPLLSEDLLRIKQDAPSPSHSDIRSSSSPSDGQQDGDAEELSERFGSLSFSQNGVSRFFGHAANGWMFMDNEENAFDEDRPASSIGLSSILPPELLLQTGISLADLTGNSMFMSPENELRLLVNYLPSEEVARQLVDGAYHYGFFSFQCIPFEEYTTNIHGPLYQHAVQIDHPLLAVRLAVMYTLLAHGAQTGLELRRHEAEWYLNLARAAMVHSRLVETPTIEGIQALHIMGMYLSFTDKATRDTHNLRWAITGLAMRLSQIIGLHSDPSRYDFSPVEIKRRRLLFAEVYTLDITQALLYGRPPAIPAEGHDVRPHSDDLMNAENDYHVWKYKFALECLSPVHAQAFSTTPPGYSTVLTLSTKVENYPAFTPLDTETERQRPDYDTRTMQSQLSRAHKEDILLHMHRPFCLLATEKHKDDPLKSEFGSSVLAAYRSAHRLIGYGETLFQRSEHPINRAWTIWARAYDAATVLGTIIIRCPHLSFAAEAYNKLRLACIMIYRVRESLDADKAYGKLMGLLDLAHNALVAHEHNIPTALISTAEAEAVLAKLGTKPHVKLRYNKPSTYPPAIEPSLAPHMHHGIDLSISSVPSMVSSASAPLYQTSSGYVSYPVTMDPQQIAAASPLGTTVWTAEAVDAATAYPDTMQPATAGVVMPAGWAIPVHHTDQLFDLPYDHFYNAEGDPSSSFYHQASASHHS